MRDIVLFSSFELPRKLFTHCSSVVALEAPIQRRNGRWGTWYRSKIGGWGTRGLLSLNDAGFKTPAVTTQTIKTPLAAIEENCEKKKKFVYHTRRPPCSASDRPPCWNPRGAQCPERTKGKRHGSKNDEGPPTITSCAHLSSTDEPQPSWAIDLSWLSQQGQGGSVLAPRIGKL